MDPNELTEKTGDGKETATEGISDDFPESYDQTIKSQSDSSDGKLATADLESYQTSSLIGGSASFTDSKDIDVPPYKHDFDKLSGAQSVGSTVILDYKPTPYQGVHVAPVLPVADEFPALSELLKRSERFHDDLYFRTPRDNSCDAILKLASAVDAPKTKARLLEMAAGTRSIVSEALIAAIVEFIKFKLEHGTEVEKQLYVAEFNDIADHERARKFITRLMTKRPLVFYMPSDDYTLKNGITGRGGFEQISTTPFPHTNRNALTIEKFMTYDEMLFSSCVSVSVPTYFINSGGRYNLGHRAGRGETFEEEGIYVGCVGARLEKPDVMEWKHSVITPEQNTAERGYGKFAVGPAAEQLRIWARLYKLPGDYFPTFLEVQSMRENRPEEYNKNFVEVEYSRGLQYFNKRAYSARMWLTVEPFLLDANERAEKDGKKAHCVVVGLGLGVWKLADAQTSLLVEVYADILKKNNLPHIAEITFSWFDVSTCGGVGHGQRFTEGGNNILFNFTRGDPAARLENREQLLVAQYAWDSNSFPGNEYWRQQFAASGDPAAACCSLITEFQNPIVNVAAFQPPCHAIFPSSLASEPDSIAVLENEDGRVKEGSGEEGKGESRQEEKGNDNDQKPAESKGDDSDHRLDVDEALLLVGTDDVQTVSEPENSSSDELRPAQIHDDDEDDDYKG